MEKTNITTTRGDSLTIVNKIYDADGKEVVVGENGQIYFTVKKDYSTEDYIFQKTLDNGISYVEGKGYVITINPADTSSLEYGSYAYDIEIVQGDLVKTVAIGTLKLTSEVTFASNEGSN